MRARGCLNNLVFVGLLAVFFGLSSYFWFKYFVRGRSIATPALVGQPLTDARAISSDSGLLLEVDQSRERHSDEVPRGGVVWQNQRPGQLVKRGTRIIVAPSLGPLILRVPDVTGQTARAARLQSGQLGLTPGPVADLPRAGPPGVLATHPPVGSVVAAEMPVSLLAGVELPPVRWVMPDVIDQPLEPIRAALEVRGLRVAQVRFEPYPGISEGTIIRQFPLPGSPVSSRDPISLVVSRQESARSEPAERPLEPAPNPSLFPPGGTP
ncbi:MAG: PASTA domain-containing protein [Thermoanaerobaculia bacterium]